MPLTGKEGTQIEYSDALGSWDFVEKGAACDELGNRQLTLELWRDGDPERERHRSQLAQRRAAAIDVAGAGLQASTPPTSPPRSGDRRRSGGAALAEARPEDAVGRVCSGVDLPLEGRDRRLRDLVDRLLDDVNGGCVQVPASMPSKPTTERSPGTSSPSTAASCIAPIAIRSLEQITAVGRSPFARSRSARSAARPPATLNEPWATR